MKWILIVTLIFLTGCNDHAFARGMSTGHGISRAGKFSYRNTRMHKHMWHRMKPQHTSQFGGLI